MYLLSSWLTSQIMSNTFSCEICYPFNNKHFIEIILGVRSFDYRVPDTSYSKLSNKRTVSNNRTGGDIILQTA